MLVRARLRIVPYLMILLLGTGSLAGCRKSRPDQPSKAQVLPNVDEVKQSLDGLKSLLSPLSAKFMALHKQFDALPPSLAGFSDVRGKFYATDEGLGRVNAKIVWLSDRLDSAVKAGNREEFEQVSKDIAGTYDEIQKIDKIGEELSRKVLPFQKMVELLANRPEGSTMIMRVLGTGYLLSVPEGGFEQRLVQFLEDSEKKVDRITWFDTDRVLFAGNGAKLDRDRSKEQLENVFEILKAYSNLKLKIGVHTDAKPGAAPNHESATPRAEAVKKELVRLGVAESRLELEPSGEKLLTCNAKDKNECKDKIGRIAMQVTAK